ncbi:carbohydrate kinase family protein [Rhizobium sp. C4]|uniref:carbohydrate kinase family protein n=1 Tax=Rhizobium sp. C4 TaxID=1349800 RepID=UPI001E46F157|nr:carbohydrate kinase family protein [Rhizobium sp. C4]MCD2175274.1 carbohydrate kinase family protein [Rhizobium sp. C4]
MSGARIVVIGGAHVDRRGRIFGTTRPGASNPGEWFEEAGGGGFNAARALSLLGHDVTMVSVAGGDSGASLVEAAAARTGVKLNGFTFLDRQTPSYTAILEADGNLVIALADMALYDLMTARRLKVNWLRETLENADFILCDANLPAETITMLTADASARAIPIGAIGISPAKIVRLAPSLSALDFVFMNEAEARVLAGSDSEAQDWPKRLAERGLKGGAITRGMKPAVLWRDGAAVELAPPAVETIGDVTGAGDAFAAGAIDAFLAGGQNSDMIRQATALARLTVLSPLAVAENVNRQSLSEMLALVPQPEMLD